MLRFDQLFMTVAVLVHLKLNIVISTDVLRIGGIFPSQTSASYLAAKIAIADLQLQNDFDGHIQVQDVFFNMTCSATEEEEMTNLVHSEPDITIWLANCHCSTHNYLIYKEDRDAIVICYGISALATDDDLRQYSDENAIMYTAEAQPSSIVQAYVRLITYYGWKRIFVVYQDLHYKDIKAQLRQTLESVDCTVTVLEIDEENQMEVADKLKTEDARIIIWLSETFIARSVICHNYKTNWYGEKYVWMFPGSYEKDWYVLELDSEKLPCNRMEMKKAANGHFIAKPLNWNKDDVKTISGMTVHEFKSKLHNKLEELKEHIRSDYDEAAIAYDSVWAAVLGYHIAVDSSESEVSEESETSMFISHDLIAASLRNVSFTGMSGNFGFNAERDRRISDTIVDFCRYKYDDSNTNQCKSIGQCNIGTFTLTFSSEPFGDSIPKDHENNIISTTNITPTSSSSPNSSVGAGAVSGEFRAIIALLSIISVHYTMRW